MARKQDEDYGAGNELYVAYSHTESVALSRCMLTDIYCWEINSGIFTVNLTYT